MSPDKGFTVLGRRRCPPSFSRAFETYAPGPTGSPSRAVSASLGPFLTGAPIGPQIASKLDPPEHTSSGSWNDPPGGPSCPGTRESTAPADVDPVVLHSAFYTAVRLLLSNALLTSLDKETNILGAMSRIVAR